MEIPKRRNSKLAAGVSFDLQSESSEDDEDVDPMFNRYLFTPPSRQIAKGLLQKQKKAQRASSLANKSSSSRSRSTTPESEQQTADSSKMKPASKWQQREISKQRDSDRTMKRVTSDVTLPSTAAAEAMSDDSSSSGNDSNTSSQTSKLKNQRLKVESRNRFMSLCSQLIKLPRQVRAKRFDSQQSKVLMSQQCRADFEKCFTALMKASNTDQPKNATETMQECCSISEHDLVKSEEDTMWQSEFKDLLWLELQAWISGRSPEQQDEYLLNERRRIPEVLKQIMEYKFEPVSSFAPNRSSSPSKKPDAADGTITCQGCLDCFCDVCSLNQSKALYEVSSLLKELENVEELYPSGRAFALDHPLYGSTAFRDRVKAMCLWYNVSCLLQLKIDIIGHMLVSLGSKGLPWPRWPEWPVEGETASASIPPPTSVPPKDEDVTDSQNVSAASTPTKKKLLKKQKSRVQFFVENDQQPSDERTRPRAEDSPGQSWRSEYSGTDLPEADAEMKRSFMTETPTVNEGVQRDQPTESSTSETDSELGQGKKSDAADGILLYRSYIEKALKEKGLRKMLHWIFFIHRVSMMRAKEALRKPDQYESDNCSSSPYQLYDEYDPARELQMDDSQYFDLHRYGAWSPECKSLNLPQYLTLYLFLCRIPLDVIRESLCIRLEQKPAAPSALSIRQLMQEFKEGLKVGVICKQKYRRNVRAVVPSDDEDTPHSSLEKEFGETLKLTLDVYLDYLKRWVCMGTPTSTQKNVLEMEWHFTRSVSSEIANGEALAGNAFFTIASCMLRATAQFLHERIDGHADFHSDASDSEGERSEKGAALSVLRRIQCVVQEAREQCLKAVAVTRMIRRDLEVAAEFDIRLPTRELLQRLAETGHIRVAIPHNKSFVGFVPHFLRDRKEYVECLLDLSSRSEPLFQSPVKGVRTELRPRYGQSSDDGVVNDGYMILLKARGDDETAEDDWKGETDVCVSMSEQDNVLRSQIQSDVLLLVVFHAAQLAGKRKELQEALGPGLELRNENKPSNYVVAESVFQLKEEINRLSRIISDTIQEVIDHHSEVRLLDPFEPAPLVSRWREVVRHCFKLGFEFHKDVIRLLSGRPDHQLSLNVIKLAHQWMNFITTHCERGRGMRPKWAAQGLDFLVTVCESEITSYLSDEEFLQLKEKIGSSVSHVIGALDPPQSSNGSSSSSGFGSVRSNPASPAIRRFSRTSGPLFSTNSLSSDANSPSSSPGPSRKNSEQSIRSHPFSPSGCLNNPPDFGQKVPLPWKERVRRSIESIESKRDSRLEDASLIGRVSRQVKEAKWHVRLKSVNFSWQRGVKIGQGRFGKVYVAVNNKTGELMAMKEIALQPGDHRTVRDVADELRIFEGIHHPHLVRYYGVEIHREEMIIFMEFCPEGTLKNLAASTEGLPEELIRRFTRQLLEAVKVLHQNGIVHRDIKGDNIFLTDRGNSLKLGDFGCAAKIKQQTTMAGELQGFVGTQAFMAPEVFMRSMEDGHGRAADIWSVGCVIIEMATGKRPWYELESNYAIMFKVGMGEVPPTPPNLSEEGQEFLSYLLQHDPKLRYTADKLLEQHFLKVYQEDDPDYSNN